MTKLRRRLNIKNFQPEQQQEHLGSFESNTGFILTGRKVLGRSRELLALQNPRARNLIKTREWKDGKMPDFLSLSESANSGADNFVKLESGNYARIFPFHPTLDDHLPTATQSEYENGEVWTKLSKKYPKIVVMQNNGKGKKPSKIFTACLH